MTENENKNLKRKFINYIVPSIASQLVFTLYTMVDAIFVARGVGANALAGVNSAAPFVTMLFSISIITAVGTSTQVSRLKGEGQSEKASGLFSMNFAVATVLSLIITVVTLLFAVPLAGLLGATVHTEVFVVKYLRTLAPFSVFFILVSRVFCLSNVNNH